MDFCIKIILFCGIFSVVVLGDQHADELKEIIESGGDLNFRYSNGQYPIIWAVVELGDVKMVRLLADNGADLSVRDNAGNTALHLAILNDKRDIMEALVESNAPLNIKNNAGQTPLDVSIALDQSSTIKYLIEHGADVPQNLKDWEQLIIGCVLQGNSDLIEALIKKGVTLKFEYEHILQSLINEDNVNATRSVLNICPINLRNAEDNNVVANFLHQAAIQDRDNIAEILIQHGANVNAKAKSDGETPIFYAVIFGREKVTKVLIKYGADVNIKNPYGNTPLHEAARRPGYEKVAEILIQNGADVNAKNGLGESVICVAKDQDNTGFVEFMIAKGVSLSGC